MADYGLIFEGKHGNMMFSDNTPSMAYMGDAVWSSWGAKTYDIGNRRIHYQAELVTGYARYDFYANTAPKSTVNLSVRQKKPQAQRWVCQGAYGWLNMFNVCSGSTCNYRVDNCCWNSCAKGYWELYYPPDFVWSDSFSIVDNARVANYTIESYGIPTLFVYSTSSSCAANVVKVTDSGSTGPSGYPIWSISVLLTYEGSATDATAKSSVRLLCFGKIDPTYYVPAGHGMAIHNASGATMFHSDFEPCKVKDILTISFASGGVSNPTQSYMSGSSSTTTGLSKPAYQAVELGRRRDEISYNIAIGYNLYMKLIEIVAGLRWTGSKWISSWVSIDLSSHNGGTSTGDVSYEPGTITVPIIDANDY
jgi:hypothetical protein